MPELTEREKEVLQSIFDSWADNEMLLPGCCCYQDVIDLVAKFGIEMPNQLRRISMEH
jgi:hypothetical protein